jgi:hypothetical protein
MSDTQYERNFKSQKLNRFHTCHIQASTDDRERSDEGLCGRPRVHLSYIPVRCDFVTSHVGQQLTGMHLQQVPVLRDLYAPVSYRPT